MKPKLLGLATLLVLISCASSGSQIAETVLPITNQNNRLEKQTQEESQEQAFQLRSLAIREKLAAQDLDKLDAWWRRINLGDPHKYLLPVILSRLSLEEQYAPQQSWQVLLNMDKDLPNLYHFRSIYDVRIFFLFRDMMPKKVADSYRRMIESSRVSQWMEQGTENHMFMQRMSGLALMDGSGWSNSLPAVAATNEAWLRSELNKFLTIGQGEFHSSTYYGYAIGGLLNLYDFAKTPELKQLAKATLDWYAANMALRLSWGTAGGAESRGFDRGTWDGSELSALAWIWWGDNPKTVERIGNKKARVAVLAALSNYRPPHQFKALARKEVPLPFVLRASHPIYYTYHEDNQFWETLYVTSDYSLGTLLIPRRSYQVKGTINAQYATYKLVIRDPKAVSNAVISLGGTFHNSMATGASPGDQYVQEKGAVIYQLRLNNKDKLAGVPGRSHLVLPSRYSQPQKYHNWYIWRIEKTWLCARPWGDKVSWQGQVSEKYKNYQFLAATGTNTAWITDVFSTTDYPTFESLKKALDNTEIDDKDWEKKGKISYRTMEGDRLEMTYNSNGGVGSAKINGKERLLENWAVLDSPYLKEELYSGFLELRYPGNRWCLGVTLTAPNGCNQK
ncbi:MAG: hypothetical protein QNJ65_20600 [Xenococcaceae cyanobacterium MO_234.B1]|nr:hypothetical protein [Xenococcaceae cyanobacterium MO_234.B1]